MAEESKAYSNCIYSNILLFVIVDIHFCYCFYIFSFYIFSFYIFSFYIFSFSLRSLVCSDNQYACNTGDQCIGLDQFCDSIRHCDDGSDEPGIKFTNKF